MAESGSGASVHVAPKRVLIAEDEAMIRLDLREMLQAEGFDVICAAAVGAQAAEMASVLNPDLVICDVKTPKMDGITASPRSASSTSWDTGA